MRSVAAGLIMLAAGALAPATASAGGFTAPRALTPTKGNVDTPLTAITSSGRTAVMWRTAGRRASNFQYVVAVGSSPSTLGKPTTVHAGHNSALTVGPAQLIALPTGEFAACFGSDPRKGDAIMGCSYSGPDGMFGPLRVAWRISWKTRPTVSFAAGSGGRVVGLLTYAAHGGKQQLLTAVLDGNGLVGPVQGIATVPRGPIGQLAALDDGSVALTYATTASSPAGQSPQTTPVLRFLAPGSTTFGSAAPLPSDAIGAKAQVFGLVGGRDLLLSSSVGQEYEAGYQEFVVRRDADGTDTPAMVLPDPNLGYLEGMTELPDGTPLAITDVVHRADDDCAALTSGAVRVAVLAPGGAAVPTLLSAPGQIAIDPQITSLADGTAIAVWGDSSGEDGAERLEVAIRAAGATTFAAPQVLPDTSVREVSLATGGGQAVMAWITGSVPDGPAHVVVSALGAAAPYAPSVPRPKYPTARCE